MKHRLIALLLAGVAAAALFAADDPRPLLVFQIASDGAAKPAGVQVRLRAEDGTQLVPPVSGLDQSIRLARGTYTLTVEAPRHRRLEQTVTIDGPRVSLGRLVLERIPVISGTTVRAEKNEPVAGASILAPNGTALATSDATGAFTAEIDGDWPEHVEVQFPGLASRIVDVPKARADVELPPIALGRGGSLRVTVEGLPEGAEAQVVVRGRERAIDPETGIAVFEDLEPRRYNVVVRGKAPLQRFSRAVEVKEGQTVDAVILLVPAELRLTTWLGETRLPRAKVWLQNSRFRWEETLTTDDEGRVEEELWQPGEYWLAVTSETVKTPHMRVVELLGIDIDEDIRLPDRRVTGRVVDARTGTPIPNAQVWLESKGETAIGSSSGATADANGVFEYRSVGTGQHRVLARADGYVESIPIEFPLGENDSKREVSFRLTRGTLRPIEIVGASGAPLGEARVAELAGPRLVRIWTARPDGTLDFTIPSGELRTLVVIPRQGSFAVARVSAAEEGPLRVVVPPAAATLDLTTRVTGGGAMPNVHFLLRYNGEVFPWEIGQLFERVQGLRLSIPSAGTARLSNLPTGFYELWPVASGAEALKVLAGTAPAAPVQVEVRPGLNSAVLHFSAVQRGNEP